MMPKGVLINGFCEAGERMLWKMRKMNLVGSRLASETFACPHLSMVRSRSMGTWGGNGGR